MGFASSGACFPDQQAALDHWCASVEPGSSFSSCTSCDAATGLCSVVDVDNPSGVLVPVSVPSCDVPTPVQDASVYVAAITALWVVAWAARRLYDFFNRDAWHV